MWRGVAVLGCAGIPLFAGCAVVCASLFSLGGGVLVRCACVRCVLPVVCRCWVVLLASFRYVYRSLYRYVF